MRIDVGTYNSLNKSDFKKMNRLKEGDVIRAKIIEVSGGVAKIDLGNGEIVEGKLDVPMDLLSGKTIKFIIKDIKENTLFMSPVYEDLDFSNEFVLKNEDVIMDRILNLSNLSKGDNSLSIIKNIIAHRMPLSHENIELISSYTEKIMSLLDLKEGQEIRAIAANDPLEEDINKLIKVDTNAEFSDSKSEEISKNDPQNISKSINMNSAEKNDAFKNISIDFLNKQNVKPEGVSSKNNEQAQESNSDVAFNEIKFGGNNTNESKEMKSGENRITEFKDILQQFDNEHSNKVEFKKITNQIQSEINNVFAHPIDAQDIIQKLTFLVKSGIDININNLSRLKEFLGHNQTLNKELAEIIEIALKEGIIDNKTKFEILDKSKSIDLKFDGKDDEKLSRFYKEISEVSEKILSQISSESKPNQELSSKAKSLNDNINFFNKMNENATLMLIPFALNNKQIENSLYVLSKRKVAKKSDNIKVYMVLNTENLESVKILCDFSYDKLNVNFKVKEEYMDLFESGKLELKSILESNGYENTLISVNKEEEENILDLISYDDTINYMLNIKV